MMKGEKNSQKERNIGTRIQRGTQRKRENERTVRDAEKERRGLR